MNNQLVLSNPNKDIFVQNIKQWVYFDDIIQKSNHKIYLAKLGRDQAAAVIERYFAENPKLNNKVAISNGEVRIREKKEYQSLTYTFVEETLSKVIENKEHVAKIIQILKDNREVKTVKEIKQYIGKESVVADESLSRFVA
jgi:hypothetical protein